MDAIPGRTDEGSIAGHVRPQLSFDPSVQPSGRLSVASHSRSVSFTIASTQVQQISMNAHDIITSAAWSSASTRPTNSARVYEEIGGRSLRRMLDGSALPQRNWGKVRTVISRQRAPAEGCPPGLHRHAVPALHGACSSGPPPTPSPCRHRAARTGNSSWLCHRVWSARAHLGDIATNTATPGHGVRRVRLCVRLLPHPDRVRGTAQAGLQWPGTSGGVGDRGRRPDLGVYSAGLNNYQLGTGDTANRSTQDGQCVRGAGFWQPIPEAAHASHQEDGTLWAGATTANSQLGQGDTAIPASRVGLQHHTGPALRRAVVRRYAIRRTWHPVGRRTDERAGAVATRPSAPRSPRWAAAPTGRLCTRPVLRAGHQGRWRPCGRRASTMRDSLAWATPRTAPPSPGGQCQMHLGQRGCGLFPHHCPAHGWHPVGGGPQRSGPAGPGRHHQPHQLHPGGVRHHLGGHWRRRAGQHKYAIRDGRHPVGLGQERLYEAGSGDTNRSSPTQVGSAANWSRCAAVAAATWP